MHILHTTRGSHKIPIAGMTTEHLKNTIQLFLRELEALTQSLNVIDRKISPISEALYGYTPQRIADHAKKQLPAQLSRLYPYLAEAMLRQLDFSADLQRILGRKDRDEAVPLPPTEEIKLLKKTSSPTTGIVPISFGINGDSDEDLDRDAY